MVEEPQADPDLNQLESRLLDELRTVRRVGMYRFKAAQVPTLARVCPEPGPGEAAEKPIRNALLTLIDPPPRDDEGRELERPLLKNRDPRDGGLLGRVIFGEAASFELQGRVISARELQLMDRYSVMRALRGESVNGGPKRGKPRGEPAYELMLDVADALVAQMQTQEAAVQTTQTERPASPEVAASTHIERVARSRPGVVAAIALAAIVLSAALVLAPRWMRHSPGRPHDVGAAGIVRRGHEQQTNPLTLSTESVRNTTVLSGFAPDTTIHFFATLGWSTASPYLYAWLNVVSDTADPNMFRVRLVFADRTGNVFARTQPVYIFPGAAPTLGSFLFRGVGGRSGPRITRQTYAKVVVERTAKVVSVGIRKPTEIASSASAPALAVGVVKANPSLVYLEFEGRFTQ